MPLLALSRAESPFSPEPRLAVVTAVHGDHVLLTSEGTLWRAQVAASCLLVPEAGDEALFAPLADGRAFVLFVLTRQEVPCRMLFPHGVTMEAQGPLSLAGATTLSLSAPETSLCAASLSMEAGEIKARAGVCSLLARTLRAAGEKAESTFSRLLARLGSSHRMVADLDETQAKDSRVSVSGSAITQAGSITHTAATVVRVDAPQVHVS